MSAIAAFRQRHGVQIVTDGAAFLPDGRIERWASKVIMLPHISAAIACRGPLLFSSLLSVHIAVTSFDELKSLIVQICDQTLAMIMQQTSVQIVVGGMSKSGPSLYIVSNTSGEWTITDTDQIILPCTEDMAHAIKAGMKFTSVEALKERDFISIVEAQHRYPELNPVTGTSYIMAGGFVQLTSVSAGAVATRILKKFMQDQIGERVQS